MAEIRVLAVHPHWAYFILKRDNRFQDKNVGLKGIEIRNSNAHYGKIAIYAIKHTYTQNEVDEVKDWFLQLQYKGYLTKDEYEEASTHEFSKDKGYILGTVEIGATSQVMDFIDFSLHRPYHLAPDNFFRPDKKTYFWWLTNPVRFSEPIPYRPPKGAIVWSKTILPEGY